MGIKLNKVGEKDENWKKCLNPVPSSPPPIPLQPQLFSHFGIFWKGKYNEFSKFMNLTYLFFPKISKICDYVFPECPFSRTRRNLMKADTLLGRFHFSLLLDCSFEICFNSNNLP